MSAAGNADTLLSSDSESEDCSTNGKAILSIDNWIRFAMDAHLAESVLFLRQKFHSMMLRRLSHPNKPPTQSDEVR